MGLYFLANQYWAVRQSRNPCLVGLSGIVIYESENGFRVITRENKLKSESVSFSPSVRDRRWPDSVTEAELRFRVRCSALFDDDDDDGDGFGCGAR